MEQEIGLTQKIFDFLGMQKKKKSETEEERREREEIIAIEKKCEYERTMREEMKLHIARLFKKPSAGGALEAFFANTVPRLALRVDEIDVRLKRLEARKKKRE